MDLTDLVIGAALLVVIFVAIRIWVADQPVRLRDASGNVIDPEVLEDDEPLDLPPSAYAPKRRFVWMGWGPRLPRIDIREVREPTKDPGQQRSEHAEEAKRDDT